MLSVWVVWMILFCILRMLDGLFLLLFLCIFFASYWSLESVVVLFSAIFFSPLRSLFKLFNYFFQGGWKRRKNWTNALCGVRGWNFRHIKWEIFLITFFINGVLCSENWSFEEIIIGRRFCSSREVDGKLILLQSNHVLKNKMMRRICFMDETR